jgi:hypothetical protein
VSNKSTDPNSKENKKLQADNNYAAFQELYELTQRKFLKQLTQYCEKMATSSQYPRLFILDLIDLDRAVDSDREDTDLNLNQTQQKMKVPAGEDEVQLSLCLKPMCENDEGWHLSDNYTLLDSNEFSNSLYSPYLARLLNIIKNGSTIASQSQLFLTQQGQKLMHEIEQKAISMIDTDAVMNSYISLRKKFIQECEHETVRTMSSSQQNAATIRTTDNGDNQLDLHRCELKNGKILWLCKKHIETSNARIIADDQFVGGTNTQMEQLVHKMLQDIDSIEINLV